MLLLYIHLLSLFFTVLGAVSEDLTLELRDSGFGFNSTVDDFGSVTLSLRWIHLIGAVGDDDSFIFILWKDRLENFLKTMTAERDVYKVHRLAGDKVASIMISIDDSIPYPTTELDFPPEPRLEDNPWMLEPLENTDLEDRRIFDKIYREYYKTYKLPKPITGRFKYKLTNDTYEYNGELVLSPEDFVVRSFRENGQAQINLMSRRKTFTLSPSISEAGAS